MADLAVVGMAVMGQNLILNLNDHGFKVIAFNRTVSKVLDFLNNQAKGTNVEGASDLNEMVSKLKSPKIVMLMIMAGQAVDDFIEQLVKVLSTGDIIIDGGNSYYQDSTKRYLYLKEKGIHFVGCGVSGGEDGARFGPSLMPGGSFEAWPKIKHIFQSISAKTDSGEPCCDWVGPEGSGHFVKMVHNGIEYGDMQLISEAYHLLRSHPLSLSNSAMSKVFSDWNEHELKSFLIQITANILAYKDSENNYVIDKIMDSASQKGTGKWTVITSLDYGTPITLIAESVFSRCLSSLKSERLIASKNFASEISNHCDSKNSMNPTSQITDIKMALYASKIISYAQGFMLIDKVSEIYNWKIDCARIAGLWKAGCIIQSQFLGNIQEAYNKNKSLKNMIMDEYFLQQLKACQPGWRSTMVHAIQNRIPIPAMSSALAFFDGYTTEKLPANLIQAQRDYFGAHMYQLIDSTDGTMKHTDWTGHSGSTTSTFY